MAFDRDEYDPDVPPAPREWLAMDEGERLELVRHYHRRAGIRLPNDRLHAAIHVVVENQIALADPPEVGETLQRLQREGLSRHDAVHAIGAAVTELLLEASKQAGTPDPDETKRWYGERVSRLTASAFLAGEE
jgi:hypothetical protein